MSPPDADVAVIGAGPAGIAAARGLLNQGLNVRLIDPDGPPSRRVESLPENGMALAGNIGLAPALFRASLGRASSMQLLWRAVPETREFGSTGPMLLDRGVLHRALRGSVPADCILTARVRGLKTIGSRVEVSLDTGMLSARFVIDARGRVGLRTPRGSGPVQVALYSSGRFRSPVGLPRMLLQSMPQGWLWACLLPYRRVSGALFLKAPDLAGLGAAGRSRCLAQHLAASMPGELDAMTTGPVVPAMLRAVEDPFLSPLILRAGDAALTRDPIASHGLVHALRSGVQAAAAAATILDPAEAADAAYAFVRGRHQDAVTTARAATSRAHAEQAQYLTAFWPDSGTAEMHSPPSQAAWPALSRPLSLAPLRRTATLDSGRIHWVQAIWLPRSGRAAPRFGPVTARQIADALGQPAPIGILSRRLEQVLTPDLAQPILRQLLDEGALGDSAMPVAGQAGIAAVSNA